MYKISDYIYNGFLFMRNGFFPRHKTLSQLMIYATNRCQSRCRHCSIWKKPHDTLSFSEIREIMSSRCVTRHTTVGLEGGEFVLHPEAEAILDWFHNNHTNYTLLSNCLMPARVIEYTRKYKPKHLYVSLDGNKTVYTHMRGVDGYDKVIQVIETLRNEVPISIMFCLTPFNSFKDMEYTINIAQKYGIDIRIGIYGTMDYFDTSAEMIATTGDDYLSKIPDNIHSTQENFDFVVLYDEWRKGNLHLRCHSINNSLVIHADGGVPICQNLGVTLGNIKNQSLDEIFNSRESASLQCQYSKHCNKCWINFHRKYDIILLRNLEKFLPKRVIELAYGKYQWSNNKSQTYHQYLNKMRCL